MISSRRFVTRSLTHHWRINLAVALGVAAATAVLTGALLVGAAVRTSLTKLTLERLGRIDEVLLVDRFFRAELANELASSAGFADDFDSATPAIVFPRGTVESNPADSGVRRAANVLVIGTGPEFWQLGDAQYAPKKMPSGDAIVLNQPLADDLQAKIGDLVTLRVSRDNQVAADSALGKKTDQVRSLPQLEVVDIIPARSLGRFSLHASQSLPRSAYVSLERLQDALDRRDKINALFVAGKSATQPPDASASQRLAEMLKPQLADYGLRLEHVQNPTYLVEEDGEEKGQMVFQYFSLTSDELMLTDDAARAAENAFPHGQPALTYLANLIEKASGEPPQGGISYSTVAAIDSEAGLGPLADEDGNPLVDEHGKPIEALEDDEIVLNSWAAQDQNIEAGDKVRVTYFEPETVHGQTKEESVEFTVKAIVPITEPAQEYKRRRDAVYRQRPTLANDPHLTPTVEGVTDKDSIDDWDAPFPINYDIVRDEQGNDADDQAWKKFRLTPKAFVSLATGQRLWGSRFGRFTSFRIPVDPNMPTDAQREELETKLVEQIHRDRGNLGFEFLAAKREGLESSSGTTPFDGLFLGLSMFVIAAAVMLVMLLFRLGVEQRADEIGVLLAVGLRRRHVSLLMLGEGVLVSLVGGLLGVALGVGYAALMILGLTTWWVGAISTPFLEFDPLLPASMMAMTIGYFSGAAVSTLAVLWGIRQLKHIAVRQLLAGQASDEGAAAGRWNLWATLLTTSSAVLLGVAVVLAYVAWQLGGMAQAGAFMSCGASVLAAALVFVSVRLRWGGGTSLARALFSLSMRNARRNPTRSTLTIGLIAAASFLIVSISAFQMRPTAEGTGGFDLLAESNLPLFANLNSASGREELLPGQAGKLQDCSLFSLRVQPGDDASCNNLYQSKRPRVLGVTPDMIAFFDDPQVQHFAWAASEVGTDTSEVNPWRVLQESPGEDDAIPVIIDANTAMYSLQLYLGVGQTYSITYEDGTEVKFRVAGLLDNSVLQGNLLIGEENFKRTYPQVNGYNYFLIRTPPGHSQPVAELLEDRLGDQGFDAIASADVLADLLAVQNTYLSTFQILGALGLLLGTFGLATVQLRSVLERRGELALMRAAGFRRARLATMVMLENVLLLVGGLATGVFSAALAVLPHFVAGGATPPWRELALMLGIVLAVGIATGLFAVRATLRAPLVAALRGE